MADAPHARSLLLALVVAVAAAGAIQGPAHAAARPELVVSGKAVLWATGSEAVGAVYVVDSKGRTTLVGTARAGVGQAGWLEHGRSYTFRLEDSKRGRVLTRTVVTAGSRAQTGRAAVLLSRDVIGWSTGTGSPARLSLALSGTPSAGVEVLDTGVFTAPPLANDTALSVRLYCGTERQRLIVSLDRARDGDGIETANAQGARCEPPERPRALSVVLPAVPFTVLALLVFGVVRYRAAVAGRA